MFKYQDTSNMSHAKYWAALALIVLGALVYLAFDVLRSPKSDGESIQVAGTKEGAMTSSVDARVVAESAAKNWGSDAVPVSQKQSDTGAWQFVYTSAKHAGTAYVIVVAGDTVASTEEVPYTGSGAPFPVGGMSESEAIDFVHTMPGRETVKVRGVEAIYNETDGVWYWGVETETGVVSVKIQ